LTITADIEDLNVSEFMMMLALNRKTGQLTIERDNDRVKMAFRNGDIVYAASTAVRETIGAMLIHRGHICNAELEAALEIQKRRKNNQLLGQILVEMDLVSIDDLNSTFHNQFLNILRDGITWSHGQAEFEVMDIPDLGEIKLDPREFILEEGLSTESLLLDGAVAHDTEVNRQDGNDYFEAVRSAFSTFQEDAPVISAEMAGAILDQAKELVDRAILFVAYPDTFSVVGGFHGDDAKSALEYTGRRLDRSTGDDSLLSWVIDERRSYRGRIKDQAGNRPLKELIGDDLPEEVIVVPVIVENQVAAILYGDNGDDRETIGHTGDLERVVARVAREMRTFSSGNRQPAG
jgi:hypothetical protein